MAEYTFTNEEFCSLIDVNINHKKEWNEELQVEVDTCKKEMNSAHFDILKQYFEGRIKRCEQRIHDNTVAIETLESLKSIFNRTEC